MADSDSTTPGKSPAFQFYPKDFLTDENVHVMSLQERGAYITLICLCWLEGTLPRDMGRLSRLCGVPLTVFRRLWPALEVCFQLHAERADRLIHPRLERERIAQADFRRRQSDNGKRGGRPRKPEEPKPLSGLTQTEPKKSSPSPISDLQSASPDSGQKNLVRARASGLMAGSRPVNHGDCLAHGPVCFRPRFAEKYLPRFGGNQEAMVAWATAVCEDWTDRVERGQPVPEGDDYAFWAARYDEYFRHTAQPAASARTIALAKSDAEFLKERN